jgi:hypothetical protein
MLAGDDGCKGSDALPLNFPFTPPQLPPRFPSLPLHFPFTSTSVPHHLLSPFILLSSTSLQHIQNIYPVATVTPLT